MTAREIIAQLRARPNMLGAILRYLADRVYDAHTANGQPIRDASDFVAWLRELADVATAPAFSSTVHSLSGETMRRHLIESTCPRCGHIHLGEAECGEDMGGGRRCRCELPVPA